MSSNLIILQHFSQTVFIQNFRANLLNRSTCYRSQARPFFTRKHNDESSPWKLRILINRMLLKTFL